MGVNLLARRMMRGVRVGARPEISAIAFPRQQRCKFRAISCAIEQQNKAFFETVDAPIAMQHAGGEIPAGRRRRAGQRVGQRPIADMVDDRGAMRVNLHESGGDCFEQTSGERFHGWRRVTGLRTGSAEH